MLPPLPRKHSLRNTASKVDPPIATTARRRTCSMHREAHDSDVTRQDALQ